MTLNQNRKDRDAKIADTQSAGGPDSSAEQFGSRGKIAPPPKPVRQDRPTNLAAPATIRETKVWKSSSQGIGRMWANYKTILYESFKAMSRGEQEALIQRMCMIITLGVGCLTLLLFYSFLPPLGRVIVVPVALVCAYWAGNNLVTPVVLSRIENILAKKE